MIPDAEIGGNRDIPGAYLGPVSYSGDLEFYPRAQMLALLMYAALGAKSSSNVAGTNEVQTITTTGTPTGGTFTLTFGLHTTAPIAYNAAAAAVQTALRDLPNLDTADVSCSGGALPTGVVVTFAGEYANENVPLLVADYSALTGGTTPTVSIATTTPGIGIIGTHVITPADTSPWVTVEERISNQFESFQYTDAKVNTLRIEAEATGYLMGSAGLVAISQSSGFVENADPDWDTTPMMVGGQVTITFNGAALPARSFNLEINNNMETDDFRLGSLVLGDIVEKRRELKLGLSYRPTDSDLYKAALYGDTGLSSPQAGPAYRGPVTIHIETFETIGNVVSGTPFSIDIDIPYCAVAPFKVAPSGDDVLGNDLELTPLRPDANEPIMTVTIINDLANVT
jgi:hypothetical protein